MRRRLNMTLRRATSVGCAVKTGETQMRRRSAQAWSAVTPACAHAAEGAAQVAALDALGGALSVELVGETAALAVVGLGEVDELEVEAEGAGELVGGGKVEGCGRGRAPAGDARWRRLRRRLRCCGGFGLATGDGGAAKGFDGVVEWVAGLLAKNLAEQHAERADVAAQGSFLELAGGGLELGQALRPVGWGPERRHD